jgi:DNA-binding transcriptional LysR family regulator
LIDGLRRKFPAIELELHADDAKSDLSTDDFDLSIRTGDQRRGRDVAVALPVAPRAPFASPKLLRRFASPMTPSDLANLPAVMRMQEPPVWSFHTSDSVRKDACPKPAFQVNTMELALASAKLGEGVAILPEFLVERDVKNGTLVRLLPDWSLDPVKVSLPCRAQRLSIPAVAVVRRLIVEECKSRSGPLVGKL